MNVKQLRAYYKRAAKPLEKRLQTITAQKDKAYKKDTAITERVRQKFLKQWTSLSPKDFVEKLIQNKYWLLRVSYLSVEPEIVALFKAIHTLGSHIEDLPKKHIPVELTKVKSFLLKAVFKRLESLPKKRRIEFMERMASNLYNITEAEEALTKKEKKQYNARRAVIQETISKYSAMQTELEDKLRPLHMAISVFSAKVSKRLPKPKKGEVVTPVIVPLPTTVSFDEMLDKVVEMTGIKKKSLTKNNLETSFYEDNKPGGFYIVYNGVALASRALTPERKVKGISLRGSEEACHQILTKKETILKPVAHFLFMDSSAEIYVGLAGKSGVVTVKAALALAIRDFLLTKPVKYHPVVGKFVRYIFDKRDPVLRVVLASNQKDREKAFAKLDNKEQKKLLKAFNVSSLKELGSVLRTVSHYKEAVKFAAKIKGNFVPMAALAVTDI